MKCCLSCQLTALYVHGCVVEIGGGKKAEFGGATEIKGCGVGQACGGDVGPVVAVIGGVSPGALSSGCGIGKGSDRP